MRRATVLVILAVTAITSRSSIDGQTSQPRQITFEDRVQAQEAIERIYYSHLAGDRRPFEQAITQDLIDRKVRTYLKQSAALEQHWHSPITADMLRREAERMERNTRFPDRLREIRTALDDDPALFLETLVRSTLADRLLRSFFAHDERIHETGRYEMNHILQALLDGRLDPGAEHPRRTVLETFAPSDATEPPLLPPMLRPAAARAAPVMRADGAGEDLDTPGESLPFRSNEIGEVSEGPVSFSLEVVLASESGSQRVAHYIVPKVSWEEWWAANESTLDESSVVSVADSAGTSLGHVSAQASAGSCPPDDTWDNGSLDAMPDPRFMHTAVWTGTEMIVWGGEAANASRYDPLTDTWRAVSRIGAPVQVRETTAVWTGSEMIVWGGYSPGSGGRYDPGSDSWSPISTVGEPLARVGHSSVWTGSEMIVWGGAIFGTVSSTGGRYDPASNTWRALSEIDSPSARWRHTAVWTGREMIVWGGVQDVIYGGALGSGARYDPASDTWTPTSSVNAPTPRIQHTAVWTGHEMIIWGGFTWSGARYDPVTDTWTPVSSTGAPAWRRAHSAVWTGTRMIVWGGADHPTEFPASFFKGSGGLYDPLTNTWQPTSQVNAATSVAYHTAVWTGAQMIVWGGAYSSGTSSFVVSLAGGRYDPASDSWTPTAVWPAGVEVSGNSPIVWTGTEMLAWSGGAAALASSAPDGGARYDPMTDMWRAITTTGAPAARMGHAMVWTGQEMVVWGGLNRYGFVATGGRYDPIADAWRPTSLAGVPEARVRASSVWTGHEMIVWGGQLDCFYSFCSKKMLATGGRYDPSTDTWRPLPLLGAPSPASGHSVVWTGREMIVWGGQRWLCSGASCSIVFTDRGARYHPEQDAWSSLPVLPPNQARWGHSATWTGREMIILGGNSSVSPGSEYVSVWRYDRAADAWSPLDPADPTIRVYRYWHTAVWTGRHILAWGNIIPGTNVIAGVIYDNQTGSWSLMSSDRAPLQRGGHSAAWTGSFMLVWGGSDGRTTFHSGGRYNFGQNTDDDGDELSECGGDCDDSDAFAWPGAPEICNGRDDNCDGVADEDARGTDTDDDGTPNACDACPDFSNPGQASPFACIAAEQDGGQCLEARIELGEPVVPGAVTLVRERSGAPDMIQFELNVSSCDRIDALEILLNGQQIAVFVEPEATCACFPPLYRVTTSDAALLQGLWRVSGDNVFGIRKPGATSPPGTAVGTFVAWIRARIGSGATQAAESVCLFDYGGGDCTQQDQCGQFGSTEDALDEQVPISHVIPEEETAGTVPITDSTPHGTIDVSSIPGGSVRLCVGPSGSPRFYAADSSGSLYQIDPATGASVPVGSLLSGLIEIAHDDLSRRTFAQINTSAGASLVEIDLVGIRSLAPSPLLGLPLSGMEFFNGRLYGIEALAAGARMMEIVPDTGFSRVLSSLPAGTWQGLAYDREAAVFYASRTVDSESVLWRIDAITGEARSLRPLSLQPSALEFGPDGVIYAAKGIGVDTELYRLELATGTATIVGRMGIPAVVSLATVRNLPRSCFEILKQGEQTLAINTQCNAPPSADAGIDLTAECSSTAGAIVNLDASRSADPDSTPGTNDGIAVFEWFEEYGGPSQTLLGTGETVIMSLPLGQHAITLRVTDSSGTTDTDDLLVQIQDTIPPVMTAGVSPKVLWPPNHRMVSVTVDVQVTDACSDVAVALVSAGSNEADDDPGLGDGSTLNDIQSAALGDGDLALELRSEREGSGNGRVYSLVYRATDGSGNVTETASLVLVPHDQGGVTEPLQISVRENGAGTAVDWSPVVGALYYNVVRGRLAALRESASEISLGEVTCIEAGSLDASSAGREDAAVPFPGEVFFYLVEYDNGWSSSFGEPSATKPRVVGAGGCR